MALKSVVDRLVDLVVGRVDAGACVAERGCCCKGTSRPHWVLTCTGGCQKLSTTCNSSISCWNP